MSASEARAALEVAREHRRNGHDYDAAQATALAQVHATLALADEQRTANLIAAFERDAISAPAADSTTAERHAYWNGIADTITQRLGLA